MGNYEAEVLNDLIKSVPMIGAITATMATQVHGHRMSATFHEGRADPVPQVSIRSQTMNQ